MPHVSTELARWIAFNIVLALVPLLANYALATYLRMPERWLAVLKGGELFIFSSTLAAAALGERLIRTPSATPPPPTSDDAILPIVGVVALIVVLVLATTLSAAAAYNSFKGDDPFEPKQVAQGSLACAIGASILSYYVAHG